MLSIRQTPASFKGMDEDTKWRPPGHEFYYRMKMDTQIPGVTLEGSVTVPAGDSIDLATAVLRRIGGPTTADEVYRRELYYRIGEVTVLASQIEAGLKRACVLLTKPEYGHFDEVEAMFSQLEKIARQAAARTLKDRSATPDQVSRAMVLETILDWSASKSLVKRRNDVVHAVWWDYAEIPPFRSRFLLNGQASMHVAADLDEFFSLTKLMREYLSKLDALVGDAWLTIYLPRGGLPPETREAEAEPHG